MVAAPDDHEINRVAAEYVRRRGSQAIPWLLEQAEIAQEIGDGEAAKAWRDIAVAAQSILRLPSN